MIKENFCSGLIDNVANGNHCSYGHATTVACFGNSYPPGKVVPVCVNEDKYFDEKFKVIKICEWMGD